ncbi:uncharacterized protein LOC119370597 [Jatropha curcas]|uniref:uncharacterized protein LOC119370597 n=1 Tax=Jatropha curcas TaxID=180498 RepID=UPI001895C875|nr:uncharacterized protein LOC119370597 [Jatropha curcas]
MYFDGASNYHGNGVGVVFKTPCGEYIPIVVKLDFDCTNNEAEYEACIKGLEAALEKGIKILKVFGDSNLIVSQALRKWKIKEERLVPDAISRSPTDNGAHFQGEFANLLKETRIQHHKSSPYRPQTGAVEVANKPIKVILQKTIKKHKAWHEQLPNALWGYRTSIRTPTGATPYSLVYGMEAVLPIELEVQSARVIRESQISEANWAENYHLQLLGMDEKHWVLDEKRLRQFHQTQVYSRKNGRDIFNKRVQRPGKLRMGCLVLIRKLDNRS